MYSDHSHEGPAADPEFCSSCFIGLILGYLESTNTNPLMALGALELAKDKLLQILSEGEDEDEDQED